MKNPRMRVTRQITKAQQTVLFAQGISIGAHPGMFRFAQHDKYGDFVSVEAWLKG